jgi:hypothetical protein
MKTRQGKSETDIRKAVLNELHCIAVCREIEDVEIEVNRDRPEGLPNWWIRRIRFRNGRVPHKGVVETGGEVSRVEAVLQSRFFAYPNGV